jgi:hypothetical protein
MKRGFLAPVYKAQRSTYDLDAPSSIERQPQPEDDLDSDQPNEEDQQHHGTPQRDADPSQAHPNASWQQCLDLLSSEQDERKYGFATSWSAIALMF